MFPLFRTRADADPGRGRPSRIGIEANTSKRRERLSLAAPERSHLAVRGQQLAAREAAAGVRHPYWNADTTRMPAALHRDFLEIAAENSMRRPGGVTVLGSPVDLGTITVDSYIMAGAADHISAWQNCYHTTQLLGGRKRFVLSTSGHIAAIVNPPGNKRATYRTADEQTPPDAAQWEALATTTQCVTVEERHRQEDEALCLMIRRIAREQDWRPAAGSGSSAACSVTRAAGSP
jgi:hypothetical protein